MKQKTAERHAAKLAKTGASSLEYLERIIASKLERVAGRPDSLIYRIRAERLARVQSELKSRGLA